MELQFLVKVNLNNPGLIHTYPMHLNYWFTLSLLFSFIFQQNPCCLSD